ncbi:HAMP domain-containing protein [Pseudoroseomonas aestuarii]|uniref:HAMP domain-containing protein n=1 Tax=Teichococcus aestuarii TaxID=568898 RepID=UPI00361C1618
MWVLTVVDLLLAALAAGLAMLFARRLMRPFLSVTAALERAGSGRFAPLGFTPRDAEANRLAQAFNLMAARLREREELATRRPSGSAPPCSAASPPPWRTRCATRWPAC